MQTLFIDTDKNGKLILRFQYHPLILQAIKDIPSRKWDKDLRVHYIGKYDIDGIVKIFNDNKWDINFSPSANDMLAGYVNKRQVLKNIKDGIMKDTDDRLKLPLRPFQVIGREFLREARQCMLCDEMGLGKAQPLTSKILTPVGWKLMSNIQIGDKIIGSDGLSYNVIGVFPQGLKDIYGITFSDGSSTECCDEHLWSVHTRERRFRKSSPLIFKTKELMSKKLFGGRVGYRYSIPLVKPVKFVNANTIPIHPYLLGTLIGDGNLSNEAIIRFSTSDSFIIEKIKSMLPNDICITQIEGYDYGISKTKDIGRSRPNIILNELRKLNLMGKKSENKFIPEIYKYSCVEDRIQLLQGLIDTDGYVSKERHLDYYTISKNLANDVIFIVQSLGGVARLREKKKTTFIYKGEKRTGQLCYRVSILLPENILPCTLPNKLNRYIYGKRKYFPLRSIKKIEYMGKKEAQCIMVDSPDHLYITDDFILTHNTVEIISAFKAIKGEGTRKMMVLCPSSVKSAWQKDITKFTDLKYQVIEGSYQNRIKQYDNPYDILIMSYDTFLMDFGATEKQLNEFGIRKHPPIPVPMIDVLVCDECQRLVRVKNKTTQSLHILKAKLDLRYIYLVTGTPIVNKIEDLWSLLYFIDPEIVGEFWQFRSRYCVVEYEEISMLDPKKRKQGKFEKIIRKIPHVVGYKNLDELKVKIEPYYIRREKKEVLTDLPDKIPETYEIELNSKQRKMYEALREDFSNEFKDKDINTANSLVFFIRAKQICDSLEILVPGMNESSKLDELKDLLVDLIENDNHKVVLFSQYKQMTDILVREFEKYNPLYLHGDVKSEDRPLLINEFQSSESKYKLFISTLQAGGVGITLTAADICIMYDRWWSPSMNEQAENRIHRIGQDKSVLIINFLCRNSIEEHIGKILERKKLFFEGMFGEDNAVLTKLTPQELRDLL